MLLLTGGCCVVLLSPRSSAHSQSNPTRLHKKLLKKLLNLAGKPISKIPLLKVPSPSPCAKQKVLRRVCAMSAQFPQQSRKPPVLIWKPGAAERRPQRPRRACARRVPKRRPKPAKRHRLQRGAAQRAYRQAKALDDQKSAAPAAIRQQNTDETQQQHIEAHRETRILVIENDVEAADHVINILESDGYAVEIATDPTYGAMLAQTYLPHLILMGALSEHLSGADFMRSLRNTSGFAERAQVTPVLYLIDNSQLLQQRFQGLRDTPLTSTIFKPANERELLQKIERALSPVFATIFPLDES